MALSLYWRRLYISYKHVSRVYSCGFVTQVLKSHVAEWLGLASQGHEITLMI